MLSLLKQHVVEDASDVDVDVVLDALQHVHVRLHRVQQLGGLRYLRGFRTVHHHAGQCSGEPGLQMLMKILPGAKGLFSKMKNSRTLVQKCIPKH